MSTVRVLVAASLAVLLGACGTSAPDFGDAQRVWCGGHTEAVITAGTSLGIEPSAAIQYKAEVEQAQLDGDQGRVTSLVLQRVGAAITATEDLMPDAHPDMKAMQSWEADNAAEWQRACAAAWEAGTAG